MRPVKPPISLCVKGKGLCAYPPAFPGRSTNSNVRYAHFLRRQGKGKAPLSPKQSPSETMLVAKTCFVGCTCRCDALRGTILSCVVCVCVCARARVCLCAERERMHEYVHMCEACTNRSHEQVRFRGEGVGHRVLESGHRVYASRKGYGGAHIYIGYRVNSMGFRV